MLKHDIFFDFDVTCLLRAVRTCKYPKSVAIVKLSDDLSCLFDVKNRQITNSYPLILNEDTYKKILTLSQFAQQERLGSNISYSLTNRNQEFLKEKDRESVRLLTRNQDFLCSIVDITKYDHLKLRKGHRQNVQKAMAQDVDCNIYFKKDVEHLTREFYNAVKNSRQAWGGTFYHDYDSFLTRNELVKAGKALLCVTEYQGKKSFVFSLVSKTNSFYYDSGYDGLTHPHIGHFAQHKIIEFLKNNDCEYYNLVTVTNKIATSNSQVKNDKVDYYKSGFSTELTPSYKITTRRSCNSLTFLKLMSSSGNL